MMHALTNPDSVGVPHEMDNPESGAVITEGPTSTADAEKQEVGKRLQMVRNVCILAFVTVGLIGNTLCLLVFIRRRCRHVSSCKYPLLLALADNVFLAALLVTWLNDQLPVFLTSASACKAVVLASYLSSFLSVWFTVCYTVERYVAVCHPLQARAILAKVPAKAVVSLLVISDVALYGCTLWTTTAVRHPQHSVMCGTVPDAFYMMYVLTWIDTAFTFVCPFLLIVVFSALIAVAVCRLHVGGTSSQGLLRQTLGQEMTYDVRSMTFSPFQTGSSGSFRLFRRLRTWFWQRRDRSPVSTQAVPQSSRGNRGSPRLSCFELKTTRSLLLLSITFVLLNLPYHVLRLRQLVLVSMGRQLTMDNIFLKELDRQISQLAYYSTFALNFFLYTLNGTYFQQELRTLVRELSACCRPRRYRPSARFEAMVVSRARAYAYPPPVRGDTTSGTPSQPRQTSFFMSSPPASPPWANTGSEMSQL
ncbi:uncharacterized protein LOC143284958 [Babylonia areolata]|uniref:uncharacterized protein LOC143284958 n=1 Tax=Babylonia areolata TaxID=304850 RepID=UPI003FD19DF7